MKDLFARAFGRPKLLIGMVHTLALPGAPLYDRAGGMRRIVEQARHEARILAASGFDALLFCNESDMPYQTRVPAETVAAMTEVAAAVRAAIELPHGINMLLDPAASIAIAHATGGRFIRAFLTGAYAGDIGLFVPDGAECLRLRERLGATDIHIICNVTAGFSVALDTRSAADKAAGAVFVGLADAVCVSGPAAGQPADLATVREVAARVPDTPVVVGTGVSHENIAALAEVADGFIVGTAIKIDGKTLNPVDPRRAEALVAASRRAA